MIPPGTLEVTGLPSRPPDLEKIFVKRLQRECIFYGSFSLFFTSTLMIQMFARRSVLARLSITRGAFRDDRKFMSGVQQLTQSRSFAYSPRRCLNIFIFVRKSGNQFLTVQFWPCLPFASLSVPSGMALSPDFLSCGLNLRPLYCCNMNLCGDGVGR